MFNLEITTSASKILKIQPPKSYLRRMVGNLIKFLEKYFGTQLLIKIPPFLHDFDHNWRIIDIAHKLQSLGIIERITKIKKYSDEPFFYFYYTPAIGKAAGSGAHFIDKEKAMWKSLAEATERHLWFNSDHFYQKHIINSSYKELKGRALDIFSLVGFSKEQKDKYPIIQFDENTVFGWIPAHSLTSKRQIFCPIQLISGFYFENKVKNPRNDKKDEPMLHWAVTTGLATGRNLEEAIVKGILEVVERDAFMISYLNKLSPPIIDLDYLANQDEEIAKIIKNFKRYNLEVYVLQLPTDFPIYINTALIIDRTGLGPALNVGASADFDFKIAFLDTLAESLLLTYSMKEQFRQQIDLNNIGQTERLIYWAQTENLPKIDFFLKGKKTRIDLKQNFYEAPTDRDYYKEKLKIIVDDLKKKNYEACYVELTTKEIKKLGLRCVQIVIPKLQPLHLHESIPYFDGERLKGVPLKLGYQPAEILNQEPHPFP